MLYIHEERIPYDLIYYLRIDTRHIRANKGRYTTVHKFRSVQCKCASQNRILIGHRGVVVG